MIVTISAPTAVHARILDHSDQGLTVSPLFRSHRGTTAVAIVQVKSDSGVEAETAELFVTSNGKLALRRFKSVTSALDKADKK